jgi:predicted DNA-binding protein (MmcQ/YjbR family)
MKEKILGFVKKKYKITGDRPWAKYPDNIVLRHVDTRKWFGLVMNVPYVKLGINKPGNVDVLNIKKDNVVIGSFLQAGILPAYHMNKASWVSVLLDGSVSEQDIEFLLNVSFELTKGK